MGAHEELLISAFLFGLAPAVIAGPLFLLLVSIFDRLRPRR